MRVAITGGTGFVGRHLARELVARGHEAVLIARGMDMRDASIYKLTGTSFFASDLSDLQDLRRAFSGCNAVAHCAGINREIGTETYQLGVLCMCPRRWPCRKSLLGLGNEP